MCAGLYPSVCEVVRPPRKFQDTRGGAQEKEVVAEEIRYCAEGPLQKNPSRSGHVNNTFCGHVMRGCVLSCDVVLDLVFACICLVMSCHTFTF